MQQLDIHSHVAVPAAAAFVKPHLDPALNPLVNFATADTRALNQKQEEDIRERITGYDRRLADLDAMGTDFQLVMPPPPQCYYTVPLDIAVEAARIVNDAVAEFVAKMPDRFAGLGSVPMPDGSEAANELTPHQLAELVRLYGADRIIMGTDYPFDMADYDPIGHVASVPDFDDATIAAIAGGNARRLLGM